MTTALSRLLFTHEPTLDVVIDGKRVIVVNRTPHKTDGVTDRQLDVFVSDDDQTISRVNGTVYPNGHGMNIEFSYKGITHSLYIENGTVRCDLQGALPGRKPIINAPNTIQKY